MLSYNKLEEPSDELVMQELITYITRDGKLLRITTKRSFFENDYVDDLTTIVLVNSTI